MYSPWSGRDFLFLFEQLMIIILTAEYDVLFNPGTVSIYLGDPFFWGPFGPQCSYGLLIHEYVTYLATDVTLHRTTINDRILETLGMVEDIKN